MKKIFCLPFLFLSAVAFAQPSLLIDKVAAILGDKTVLQSEVEGQFQQYLQQYKGSIDASVKCDILNEMLTAKMLTAQALRDSVAITDDEVENELERKIRYYTAMIGSKEKLEAYYGKSIVEIKDEFRSDVREQMLADREQQNIIKDVKVTPAEVQKFFDAIPADSLPFYNAEVEVRELVVYPKVSPDLKEYAKQQIADLRNRVMKGESFAALAASYSKDPGSRDKGGELGFMNRGELDPNFEAAAFKLKVPGDVSDVVESSFGFHIIQLIERRGEKINVRHILIIPQTTSFDLARAKTQLDSIRHLIVIDSIKFPAAVYKFSEEDNSKHNGGMLTSPRSGTTRFEISDLDKNNFLVIDTMKEMQISSPVSFTSEEGKNGYRIIQLVSRSVAHKGNLKQDYDKFQEMALQQKQQKELEEWLLRKVKNSYVYIDADYVGCNLLKKWNATNTIR